MVHASTASTSTSCVVIAFNEQDAISETIDALLAQSGDGFEEIIVVDDGSTDSTADIVRRRSQRERRIRLESLSTNRGRGAARAHGIESATCPLIAMVDADIVLPPTWLATCLGAIGEYDAVGGIAVPDGDATYVAKRFGLVPRVRPATTQVTGNNGLYRQEALRVAQVDPELREGEDVALNEDLTAAGFRLTTLRELVVRHNEFKTFSQTVSWLYQSGTGASRQLRCYRRIRTPDIALFGFAATMLVGLLPRPAMGRRARRVVPVAYLVGVGFAHLSSRFDLTQANRATIVRAVAYNTALMASYFVGRLVGSVPRS